MGTVKTLHIVGYRDSGKTTLVSYWIRVLKEAGLRVAVIKHHGHGAKLAMPDKKKDSMQYLENGADTSIVSGGGYTQHIAAREMKYEELIQLALTEHPDIILVEGYKVESAPKVVLIGNEEDWESIQHLENIQLVIGLKEDTNYPQIDTRENTGALKKWIVNWIQPAVTNK